MKTVNIGTLRNQLSAYLRYVKNGEEVIVRERNVAIARIVGIPVPNEKEERAQLIATGQLKPAQEKIDWDAFWELPAGNVSRDAAVDAATWAKGDR